MLQKNKLTTHVMNIYIYIYIDKSDRMNIWKRKRYNIHHHIIRKSVMKQPHAWALFVLERMF